MMQLYILEHRTCNSPTRMLECCGDRKLCKIFCVFGCWFAGCSHKVCVVLFCYTECFFNVLNALAENVPWKSVQSAKHYYEKRREKKTKSTVNIVTNNAEQLRAIRNEQ